MIKSAALLLALVSPVAAETPEGPDLCAAVWERLGQSLTGTVVVSGQIAALDADWCRITDLLIDAEGQYQPDLHADELKFRGSALSWILNGSGSPEELELKLSNLRIVVETGAPQLDWLFGAQARANTIDAEVSLAWNGAERTLSLQRLFVDFPGDNVIEATARIGQVDLSSEGAAEMSLTSFALTDADIRLRSHGLFESFVLIPLGSAMLPTEGDIGAAFAGMQAELQTAVADLPATSFSDQTKAALTALITDLPNPAGEAVIRVTATPGIGPARLGPYALIGVPGSVAEAAPMFQGVVVDVQWSRSDAE